MVIASIILIKQDCTVYNHDLTHLEELALGGPEGDQGHLARVGVYLLHLDKIWIRIIIRTRMTSPGVSGAPLGTSSIPAHPGDQRHLSLA